MELALNFEKTFISKSIGILLQENLPLNEVETLKRILQGKKAQYRDANNLLCSILRALENKNEREEAEFTIPNDEDQETNASQGLSQPEQLDQTEHNTNSPTQKDEELPCTSKGTSNKEEENSKDLENRWEGVCKFYRNGRCKFGKECRKPHPNFCTTFIRNGPKSQNQKGCDGKCAKLHPNVCRQSLKTKECGREDCRFYHLKGTSRIKGDTTDNRDNRDSGRYSTSSKHNSNSKPKQDAWGGQIKTAWEQPRASQEPNGNQDQSSVFREAQIAMMNAIAMLAHQMEDIRKLATAATTLQPQLKPQQSQYPWAHTQLSMSQ